MWFSMNFVLPPAAMPDAAARASNRPTATNGVFGRESISSVTLPAWYRRYKIVKYTSTYLGERRNKKQKRSNSVTNMFTTNF